MKLDMKKTITIDTADMCNLAHTLTVRDCNKLNITIDQTDDNGDIHYTEEAQDIFNDYCDIITNSLEGDTYLKIDSEHTRNHCEVTGCQEPNEAPSAWCRKHGKEKAEYLGL
jgi:hypothetical protein